MKRTVYIGWDPREHAAYQVALSSAARHLSEHIPIHGLVMEDLRDRGLYRRPTEHRMGPSGSPILWDTLSDAPMATQHANARFLVKDLAGEGWALFMDGDVLVRADLNELFDNLDPTKALYCVQHEYTPRPGIKMDGQVQTVYRRKNWTSVMCINASHPANRSLTSEMINTVPGRDLHAISWLEDRDIGNLDGSWNYLVGEQERPPNVRIAHFTRGVPDMAGHENCEFADEWRAEQRRWAA